MLPPGAIISATVAPEAEESSAPFFAAMLDRAAWLDGHARISELFHLDPLLPAPTIG